MVLNFKEIATASMVLFAVIDIVGSVPVIIGLRNKVGHIQSEKASVVAAVIMIAFLFVGGKNPKTDRDRCELICRGWFTDHLFLGHRNGLGDHALQRRRP